MNANKLIKSMLGMHVLFLGCADGLYAHSMIKIDGGYIKEGHSSDAKYRIEHGCDGKPILAASLMIPTQSPKLSRADGGAIEDIDASNSIDLGDIIDNPTLAGIITPHYELSVFKRVQRKTDSLDNAIGFNVSNGKVPDRFLADVAFEVNAVFFKSESCANQMVIHPVGADICKLSSRPSAGEVNIWMEHPTSAFSDVNIHGIGENALRIVYQRDLEVNPLPERCSESFSVDVYATDEDINANLPIKKLWPR